MEVNVVIECQFLTKMGRSGQNKTVHKSITSS